MLHLLTSLILSLPTRAVESEKAFEKKLIYCEEVVEKDEDFKGCRILETQKNRFGGCGHMFYLALRKTGFREVAKIEEF